MYIVQGVGSGERHKTIESWQQVGTATEFTAPYCTVVHWTAVHCTALHCTELHCTTLHCTALHCTALHCTELQCSALQFSACCLHNLALQYTTCPECDSQVELYTGALWQWKLDRIHPWTINFFAIPTFYITLKSETIMWKKEKVKFWMFKGGNGFHISASLLRCNRFGSV